MVVAKSQTDTQHVVLECYRQIHRITLYIVCLCNNPPKQRFLLCMQQTTLAAYTLPRLLSIFISFT